jgi:hypothetical protein
MAMRRREFLTMGAVGSAAWLVGCEKKQESAAPAPASTPTQPEASASVSTSKPASGGVAPIFNMKVNDGYAYVFMNGRKKLVVGAIDAALPGGGQVMKHPILVRVLHGTVKGNSPIPLVANSTDTYDLTGWHIELDLGKQAQALSVPPEKWVTPILCPTTIPGWNNLAWLPDAKKIYNNRPMKKEWPKYLSSRFVITHGAMEVLPSVATGMWSFQDDSKKERLRQPMSDGTRFSHGLTANDVVTFNVFKLTDDLPAANATPDGQLIINQDTTGVGLEVWNGLPAGQPYKLHEPVPHFGRYEVLIDGPDHVLPYFEACDDGKGACPGDFCPYGRFEV